MKKAIFDVIKKADFVLVFVLAILGIVAVSATLIRDFLPRHRAAPNRVAVVEDEHEEITEYTDFEAKIKDAYVFSVKSSAVKADTDFSTAKTGWSGAGFANSLGRGLGGDGVTNFIFVKDGGQTERKLFSANVFIYKYHFASDEDDGRQRLPRERNVYAVVKRDTSGDKILSSEDDIALLVSDYDGANIKEISSSIVTFRFIGGEEILFSEYDGKNQTYFSYDCKTDVKTMIQSVAQTLKAKEIALY